MLLCVMVTVLAVTPNVFSGVAKYESIPTNCTNNETSYATAECQKEHERPFKCEALGFTEGPRMDGGRCTAYCRRTVGTEDYSVTAKIHCENITSYIRNDAIIVIQTPTPQPNATEECPEGYIALNCRVSIPYETTEDAAETRSTVKTDRKCYMEECSKCQILLFCARADITRNWYKGVSSERTGMLYTKQNKTLFEVVSTYKHGNRNLGKASCFVHSLIYNAKHVYYTWRDSCHTFN